MAVPDTTWKVLPHGALRQFAENLWDVEGALPNMSLQRRMVVARLGNGDLVLHSAIALDDAGMAQLESLGRPAWLVVPNGWHRLDAARYKARYPDLQVVCPRDSRKRVEEVVPVVATYETFVQPSPESPTVWFAHFGGKKQQEGAMYVRSRDGVSVVLGDSLFNLPHQKGFYWFVYGRLLGSTGGPKVTLIGRLVLMAGDGKAAFRTWLEQTAALPDLVRVFPAHGDVIAENASAALHRVAATL